MASYDQLEQSQKAPNPPVSDMSPQSLLANAFCKSNDEEGPHFPAPEMILQNPPTVSREGPSNSAKIPPTVSRDKSPSGGVNPHHLVAMASHAIGSSIRPGTDRGHGSVGDLASWNDPGGITSGLDRATNERTFPILEAFASLCVWKSKAQVIAVSLQKDDIRRQVCLTIAENGGVDHKTISHVKDIWGILKELSDQYANERNKKAYHGKWNGWTGDPPDAPKGVGNKHKQMLIRKIYTFSMLKNRTRIDRWWKRLHDFANRFQASKTAHETTEYMEDFHIGVNMLGSAVPLLQSSARSEEDWIHIVRYMSAATICLQPLLKNQVLCESWASECKDFANSPRLRSVFEYTLTVKAVPASTCTVMLPTSVPDWKLVLNSVCHGSNFQSDFLESESLALSNAYPKAAQECVVHSECSLIGFLESKHGDDWDNIPALGFIGVSKLSCRPGYNWVEKFNTLGGRRYITKGTHGKYYWPWAMPTLQDPTLDIRLAAAFVESVRSSYMKFYVLLGKLRIPTDSTDALLRSATAYTEDDLVDAILRSRREFKERLMLIGL